MAYVDTSVLVAYYCPEPLSEKVETFLRAHTKPTISALTEIELFSAVSKKVRTKGMKRKDAGRVVARFMADIENGYYTYLPLEASHYRLARDWIGMFILPLRTLDALHLAISSSEGLDIVTIDPGLFKSAKALSLSAILLE
jgi:predicted nucleic acid-binding protein